MKEIIESNEDLWGLFTKKNEYFLEKPEQYRDYDFKGKKFNVLQPEISKFMVRSGFKVKYPDNKGFAVCLTHDVDEIYPPFSHMLLSSLYHVRDLNFRSLKREFLWRRIGKEYSPYWNFKEIMNLEEKYNARSTFYFLATDQDIRRFRYNIEDLKKELASIVAKGWEVGLHGGYYAYNDLGKIKNEKERLEKVLGQKVTGYRNHYLRFKVPETWEFLSKTGFKYDSTLGYTDMVGFRNGLCHPFKPFNLNNNREIDILEIPLNIMDGALFSFTASFEPAFKIAKNLIDTVQKYKGVLTLLWHSNNFNCAFKESWVRLYEDILKYCYEKNAWLTSGEEVWRWWENGSCLDG
ncbi:MAG: hypothetical protein C4589_07780 [Peptococcaceae bacterium]|nr:MAG: hypothetical protein C4589_07780 [Peptococcaceae bacterium]